MIDSLVKLEKGLDNPDHEPHQNPLHWYYKMVKIILI